MARVARKGSNRRAAQESRALARLKTAARRYAHEYSTIHSEMTDAQLGEAVRRCHLRAYELEDAAAWFAAVSPGRLSQRT